MKAKKPVKKTTAKKPTKQSTAKKPAAKKTTKKYRPATRKELSTIKKQAAKGLSNKEILKTLPTMSKSRFYQLKSEQSELVTALSEARQSFYEKLSEATENKLLELVSTGHTKKEEVLDKEGDVVEVITITDLTAKELIDLKERVDRKFRITQEPLVVQGSESTTLLSFTEFMTKGGYPEPFPKQIEAYNFFNETQEPSLLLGSRGYGKTDYLTIGGVAYEIYLNSVDASFLIVTKSEDRNKAIMMEIKNLLEANGVSLKESNSTSLRAVDQQGKDANASCLTLRSASFRGRHPRMIIMDDPVTPEDISEATRKLAKRVYEECTKLTQSILIIGQPVHTLDLYEELRGLDGFRKMELPYGSIPELDPDLEAAKLAGVSEESISASYHLKVINENPMPFENIKTLKGWIGGDTVAFIDPSFEGGDFTAVTIGRAYLDGIAVLGRAYKRSWDSLLSEFKELVSKYNIKRICFETNSLGTMPVNILNKELPCSVVGRKTVSNKHARIVNAGTFAEYLHLSTDSNKDYTDQVKQYEYKSKYDDSPDSLASLLEWLGVVRGV